MKYTNLELVQIIASSMDSDEVNSIFDSVESMQIAKIVRTVYYDIINRANLPENYSLKNLQASTDSSKPVVMYVPEDVAEIKWLKYDNATSSDPDVQMVLVKFLPLDQFLDNMDMMDQSGTNVDSFTMTSGTDSYTFMYWTDRHPQYYTSFDDNTLIFDAYYKSLDTTLRSSKTRAYCRLNIPFTMSDSFTFPPLNDSQFELLLNEAKAQAWAELKQTVHPKAEQNAKRGWLYLNNTKFAAGETADFNQLPDFGRKHNNFLLVKLH